MRRVVTLLLALVVSGSLLVHTSPSASAAVFFRVEDQKNMPGLNPQFDMTALEYFEDPARPGFHFFNIHLAAAIRKDMFADDSWIVVDLYTDGDEKTDFSIQAHSVDDLSRVPIWEAAVWNFDTGEWLTGCDANFRVSGTLLQFSIDYDCLKLPTEFGMGAYSDFIPEDKKSYDYLPEPGDVTMVYHSFGDEPLKPSSTSTVSRYKKTLLPSFVPSGEDQGRFRRNDLIGITNPIYLPNLNNRLSCSNSTIKLFRNGNRAFQRGDVVRVESSIENGPKSLNSAMQNPGQRGIREVFSENYTNTNPSLVGLNVALCTRDITDVIPRYLTIYLTVTNPSRKELETLRLYMQVIRDEVIGSAVENIRNTCALGAFETTVVPLFANNLIVEQGQMPGASGGQTTISGTLFRQGILASNEEITFYQDVNGQPGRIIGSTRTDRDGQFSYSFNLQRVGNSKVTKVFAYIPERTDSYGKVSVAFLAFTFTLEFDWEKGGAYVPSTLTDWVPKVLPVCALAFDDLDRVFGDEDDRHPLAFYIASRVLRGIKNKDEHNSLGAKNRVDQERELAQRLSSQNYSSNSGSTTTPNKSTVTPRYNSGYSSSGGGTRCHSVRGYYRNGKYVRGYVRCR